MTDYNGDHIKEDIPYKYYLPTDTLSAHDQISLDDFEEWLRGGDRTDLEKRTKLRDKVITAKGNYLHNGYREIRYWHVLSPPVLILKFIQAMHLKVRWQKFEMLDFGSYKPTKNL